jgi:hypothetical protein
MTNYPDNYWCLLPRCPGCGRDVFESDCECEGVRKQLSFSRSSVSGRGVSREELKRWLECGSTGRALEEVYDG